MLPSGTFSVTGWRACVHDHQRAAQIRFRRACTVSCTAIREELIRHYGSQAFLYKHASIHDFKRVSPPAQAEYFSFAAIRNPMDQVVTKYLKHRHGKRRRGTLRRRGRKRGRTRLECAAPAREVTQRHGHKSVFRKILPGPLRTALHRLVRDRPQASRSRDEVRAPAGRLQGSRPEAGP